MNIYRKDVVIYSVGRLQKDFEYLFDTVNIVGYIGDDKDKNEYNGKPYLNLDKLDKDYFKKKIVIICLRRTKNFSKYISNRFKKLGLFENRSYAWFEDIAYLLDDRKDEFFEFISRLYNHYIKRSNYTELYTKNSELLKKMIYTDSFDGPKCDIPFKYMHVQPDGNAYICCPRLGI